jgi:hypothetical protein
MSWQPETFQQGEARTRGNQARKGRALIENAILHLLVSPEENREAIDFLANHLAISFNWQYHY